MIKSKNVSTDDKTHYKEIKSVAHALKNHSHLRCLAHFAHTTTLLNSMMTRIIIN